MKTHSDKGLESQIEQILSGPRYPERYFTLSGHTYKEVYEMALGLTSLFSSLDLSDTPICLCAESKAVIGAALLAALSCGFTLVLPYAHSPHVLSELHNSTGFKFAISDNDKDLPHGVEAIIPLSRPGQVINLSQKTAVDPDREWLRLYTGGSTGTPRIWSKTIKNLLGEASYLSGKYHMSPGDRIISTVSPCHIYGLLYSVLVPMVSSACVLDGICTFPNEIINEVGQHSATLLIAAPLHYRALRGHTIPGSSLRLAFSSAGVLAEEDGSDFYRQNGIGVDEIYGSTETGGIASRCRAKGETGFTAFDDIDWKITDERLHVRSGFISPEIIRQADGFFMTADRAMPDGDNGFVLLGRSDAVIKVAGKRVDLEEIHDKLKKVTGVSDAVVIAIPVLKGRENAIAAVVEGNPDKTHLRKTLSDLLEPYAIPRSIKIVDQIPSTASGKYDREAIEKMFRTEFRGLN
jgi:acyl-coenzyme A synthetase/AMP-(fatty) acid ligase